MADVTDARRQTAERLTTIEANQAKSSARMDRVEQTLNENTAATLEMRDILAAAKGAFRVLGWLGTMAKWAGGIAAAAIAIYQLVTVLKTGDITKIDIPK